MKWTEEICNLTKAEEEVLKAAHAYAKALSEMKLRSITNHDYDIAKTNLLYAAGNLPLLKETGKVSDGIL